MLVLTLAVILTALFSIPIAFIVFISWIAEREHKERCRQKYTAVTYAECPPAFTPVVETKPPQAIPPTPEPTPEPTPAPKPAKPAKPAKPRTPTLGEWVKRNADKLVKELEIVGKHELPIESIKCPVDDVVSWLLEQESVSTVKKEENAIIFFVETR